MSPNRSYPSRPGFTFIECLVLVLIIIVAVGIMLALVGGKMIPTALDNRCKNTLRDLGLSIWIYDDRNAGLPCNDGTNSVFFEILDEVDPSDVRAPFARTSAVPPGFIVSKFVCPADRSEPGPTGAPTSYVFNAAVFRGAKDKPLRYAESMENPSNTLLAGERLAACGKLPFYTLWTDAAEPRLSNSVPACMFGVNNVGPDAEPIGSMPTAGMPVLANTNQANCLAPPVNQWSAAPVINTAYFQSSHARGVNFVRGEGGSVTMPGNYDPQLVNLFCVPIKRDNWSPMFRYNTPAVGPPP